MSEETNGATNGANGNGHLNDSTNGEHDPYYPPIISLPEVQLPTGEDGEEEVFKIRSKIYRWDAETEPPEWKERGTGDVRILKHSETDHYRVIMRRDKTLKVCANHFIRPWMMLQPMKSNDKAWMYQVHADFADAISSDEKPKAEVFAIRFGNPENATKFKTAFDKAVMEVIENEALIIREAAEADDKEEGSASGDNNKDGEKKEVEKLAKSDEGGDASGDKDVSKDLEKLDLKK